MIACGAVLQTTPFHPRTAPLVRTFKWKDWNGFAAPCTYDGHSEQEYYAFRHAVGLLDVTPLRKIDVTGPGGARLLSRVMTRDFEKVEPNRVAYCAMADEDGKILDDCTVLRLGPQHWRVSASERWVHWLRRHGRGLEVSLEDTSDRIAVLALQGPRAREVLYAVTELDVDRMRFFRVRNTKVAGRPVAISRTGYTGDLGFELWMDHEHALPVWDALIAAGAPFGIQPCGLDALDVVRIEAGYVLGGVDYICSRACLIEPQKSSPDECGLGWTIDLEGRATRFVGQDRVERERQHGSAWAFVGLDVDWAALESLYEEFGLPPHLGPVASREAVPLFDADGNHQVGQVTSRTWSPLLKRYLALGQVHAPFGKVGTALRVEHTVEFQRRQLPCRVVERPFYDPPHKRAVREAAP